MEYSLVCPLNSWEKKLKMYFVPIILQDGKLFKSSYYVATFHVANINSHLTFKNKYLEISWDNSLTI